MLFSILKDSLILFLLVYALLTLAENITKFLEHMLEKPSHALMTYHIIDIRNISADELEIPLKSASKSLEGHILLLTEELSTEEELILSIIEKKQDNIHHITYEQLQKISGSPEETANFFIHGDDRNCHSNLSIFS